MKDTREIFKWHNLRAAYIINLRNERIKELEHVRWQKGTCHICSVINLNELHGYRIVRAYLSGNQLKMFCYLNICCISVDFFCNLLGLILSLNSNCSFISALKFVCRSRVMGSCLLWINELHHKSSMLTRSPQSKIKQNDKYW